MLALPCAAPTIRERPLHRSPLLHSAIALLPFADAANPGGGSVTARLVDHGPLPPVGSPQSRQRMQTRHQRNFFAYGVDNPIEFHFAHHTLQSAGRTFCRQVGKRGSVRGPALSTYHHASLLLEGSATVTSMAKRGRNREGQITPLHETAGSTGRWPPPLGPTWRMRARFGHESGELACL